MNMSTRCYIAIKNNDNSMDAIYCHYDGYPRGVGNTLNTHYTNEDKIRELISLGDISSLGEDIESTVAYHRDYGEDLVNHHFDSEEDFREWLHDSWAEYVYKWEKNKSDDPYYSWNIIDLYKEMLE